MKKKTQQKNSTGEKELIMGSHQQFQTPPRGQNWETALSSFLEEGEKERQKPAEI